MKLETFKLEEYNDYKIEHRSTLIELWNDDISREYLYDLTIETRTIEEKNYIDERNQSYIVYIKDTIVGYISIMGNNEKFHISYAILPKYRNKGLATILLKEFTKKIFSKYNSINELSLIINKKNIASQHVANKSGYKKELSIKYIKYRNDN